MFTMGGRDGQHLKENGQYARHIQHDPKLSVIVPVYNAARYLDQCLDSILGQKFRNIEVILVNDKSIDNSGDICESYAEQDVRVKVLHLDHKGVSYARNSGMEIASGDYITFVDADDWIESSMYCDMLELLISQKADICMCGYTRFNAISHRECLLPWANGSVFEGEEIREKVLTALISPIDLHGNKQSMLFGAVFRCVFDQQFIQQNQLHFNNNVGIREGFAFMVQATCCADKLAICKSAYYHYRRDFLHKTSITHKYIPDGYQHLRLSQQIMANSLQAIGWHNRMQRQIEWANCLIVLSGIGNLSAPGSPYSWTERVRLSRQYIIESNFDHSAQQVHYSFFLRTHQIVFLLARHSFLRMVLIIYAIKYRFGLG